MRDAFGDAPGGEVAFYFGPPDRALFGWYHPARGAPRRCGVVIAGPLGDDAVRAHRPLRHLAERLARAGFAVMRFDFHGTGDSSGDDRMPDRARTWIRDVELAIAELSARSGAPATAIVGLRLGATLATIAAAASGGVDSLVLYGPHTRGGAHVTEVTRLQKMLRLIDPRAFAGGPRVRGDGEEACGFLLTHDTIAGLSALDLRTLRAPPARRALVVSEGRAPDDQEIQDHLRSLGTDTDHRVLAGCQQFLVEVPHKSRLPDGALDAIVAWLSEAHPPGEEAPPEAAQATSISTSPSHSGEEPVVFGRSHRLFGIFHRPAPSPVRGDLPPIVLASAGTVHRIGPHRFHVALARRWASLGFPVLRVDLSGIGDSPAGDDGVENVTYPRDGYDDLGEAMALLGERTGARRFVVAGLCSGGDYAFQAGLRDPRVRGVVMMNPRTFCVNDLAQVESGNPPAVLAAAGRAQGALGEAVTVPDALRDMAARGVDTLLVVTRDDPGVRYVDARWGDAMRALAGLPGFRREDVEGTDHNFTSLWSQETVSDLVTEHLVRASS